MGPAGDVYVTGSGDFDGQTIRYDADGAEVWSVRTDAVTNDVAVGPSGDVYVTGYVADSPLDAYTARLDGATGAVVWNDTRDGDGTTTGVAVDDWGNVYATGSGGTAKYDAGGTHRWTGQAGTGVAVGPSGAVFVTGDSATVRLDNGTGSSQWSTGVGGFAVAVDSSGDVVAVGTSAADYRTVKFDGPNGTEQWRVGYDSGGEDEAEDVAVGPSGDVYVTGTQDRYASTIDGDNYYTVRYDGATGAAVWNRSEHRGGAQRAFGLAVGPSGTVYVTGVNWVFEKIWWSDMQVETRGTFYTRAYAPTQKSDGPVSFTVDTTPPAVRANASDYPGDQTRASDGQQVVVTVSATDAGVGVANVTVDASAINATGSIDLASAGGQRWTAAVTPDRDAATGTYDLTVVATDVAGNHNDTRTVTVAIDNTPPEVPALGVAYPANQTRLSDGQAVTITANATDAAAGVGAVAVNATAINTTGWVPLARTGDGTWTTSVLADRDVPPGTYNLTVRAVDNATNVNATRAVQVDLDTAGPSVVPNPTVYPGGQTWVTDGQPVVANVSAADADSDVVSVTVDASAINRSGAVALSKTGSGVWTATLTPDRNATTNEYELPITATDDVGNVNDTRTVTVAVDNAAPAVQNGTVDYPADQTRVRDGQAVTLSVPAGDAGSGIDTLSVDASAINTTGSLRLTRAGGGTWTTTLVPDRGAAAGTYHLPVNATDNVSHVDASAVVSVAVDNGVPSVSPNPTSYPGTQSRASDGQAVVLNVSAADAASNVTAVTVNASAINRSGTVSLAPTGDTWTGTVTLDRNATTGTYAIPVVATDAAGNHNDTRTVDVVVDNAPPRALAGTIDYPTGQAWLADGQPLAITVSASDPEAGVRSVAVNASGVNTTGWVPLARTGAGNWTTALVPDAGAPSGRYNLTVRVTDNASNHASAEVGSLALDNEGPAIAPNPTAYPPGQTWVTDGQPVTVTVSLTDRRSGVGNASVDALPINRSGTIALSETAGGNWTATLTPDRNVTGSIDLTVSAVDNVANDNRTTVSVNVDNAAPRLVDRQPAPSATVSTDRPTVRVDVTDEGAGVGDSGIDLWVDGTNVTADATREDGGLTYRPERLAEGTHSVRVQTADGVGNERAWTWKFTVDSDDADDSGGDGTADQGSRACLSTGSGLRLAPGENGTVRLPDGAPVDELLVTAGEPIADLVVEVGTCGFDPDAIAAPDAGPVYSYFSVTTSTPDEAIERATLTTSVERSWLDEIDRRPADLVVLRRENGTWRTLPTRVVAETGEVVTVTAETPGFSVFAIAVTGDPQPQTTDRPTGTEEAGTGGGTPADQGSPTVTADGQTTLGPADTDTPGEASTVEPAVTPGDGTAKTADEGGAPGGGLGVVPVIALVLLAVLAVGAAGWRRRQG